MSKDFQVRFGFLALLTNYMILDKLFNFFLSPFSVFEMRIINKAYFFGVCSSPGNIMYSNRHIVNIQAITLKRIIFCTTSLLLSDISFNKSLVCRYDLGIIFPFMLVFIFIILFHGCLVLHQYDS